MPYFSQIAIKFRYRPTELPVPPQPLPLLLRNRRSDVGTTDQRLHRDNAVAATQNSVLGNGGATHRNSDASRFIDHGHHALFDLNAFLSLGGYDEAFSHNEDAEFDYRLARAGGKIWMCSEAAATYFPRSTPGSVAKQYFRHGQGRADMLVKHKARPRLRQLLPIAALALFVGGILGSFFSLFTLLGPLVYVFTAVIWGCYIALRSRNACAAVSGVAAIIMHLSWASGLIAALVHSVRLSLPQQARAAAFTRDEARQFAVSIGKRHSKSK
jgi:succinoglycan biosynthesis protein ExoA